MTRQEEKNKATEDFLKDKDPNLISALGFGYMSGIEWADEYPNEQMIAKYLYEKKGYPVDLNGNLPTFDDLMEDCKTYNVYLKKQLIKKACEWFRGQEEIIGISFQEDFFERFKQAMEE